MPALVSEVYLWEDDGRLWVRLRTNVSADVLQAWLSALGLGSAIETLEPVTADPARGGHGFLLRCHAQVQRDVLRRAVEQL
ncbi:MAG: hypothetical protein L0Z62_50435 [Gemmataceae bacterium]|nr:hypothetical protein [Gemmataceae bacterium]